MEKSRLFKPITIGRMEIAQRIGMCPVTRLRATDEHVPTPMMAEYYTQRASVPGTLLITEATFMHASWGGLSNIPGIYNETQVAAWRAIADAVHAKGSYIFCQIYALGRTADREVARAEGIRIRSASAIRGVDDDAHVVPEPLTVYEIQETVQQYAAAARNVMAAGFDGVEIHGANGYIIDQFLQDVSNQRIDEYGGCVENRSRFAVEVVQAVVDAVGAERVGVRFSPWSTYEAMGMRDPIPQFSDVIKKIAELNIAYLSLIEGRIRGDDQVGEHICNTLNFAYSIWKGPMLLAGGYTVEQAKKLVDDAHPDRDIVVMFGRFFISNPDLVFKVKNGIPLTPYNRSTFYTAQSAVGYTDYPFSERFMEKSYGGRMQGAARLYHTIKRWICG
ncbi:NADPH dehydrogenase [Thozetella sp. PMI_491]|nr:NADPH dehydrogenase [Thozetella sp. PMI_491]